MKNCVCWWAIPAFILLAGVAFAKGVYQTDDAFITSVFGGQQPETNVVWMRDEVKQKSKEILGHRYPKLRVKFWTLDGKSAWILNEIGKTKAITAGIVIKDHKVDLLRILEFRESRGDEIRYGYFTDQFFGVALNEDSKLDQPIDAITGATLSVRAVKKMARLALYLDAHQRTEK